ncbi:hypothetical protein [Streptomyces europaeiscabiei]|nr:hypothetical protein [Streptomyces europaeiscabiei]MDX2529749.1 hypothetical protein [Streptomyces europaeiscabiei]MDX2766670.1 hypothetical protein [Streptomyces europaeiscabiei]MDX3665531.1 hypothetical protein [Streptomyces europaeiscabiei]MDX3713231.1 hypothetical protein [Streptomyces europaeiscabiei]MDX3836260.1 hypothetical protein [Streptomyces europaeiscabiei]
MNQSISAACLPYRAPPSGEYDLCHSNFLGDAIGSAAARAL